jgi:hypothetical protein
MARWRIRARRAGRFDELAAGTKAERIFLNLLQAHAAQGRDVSPKVSNTFAPSVFAKHPSAEGVTKHAFAHAMERLLAANRIRVEMIGPPSRRYSRLAIAPPQEEP